MNIRDLLDEVRREPTYTNHIRAFAGLRATGWTPPGPSSLVAVLSDFTVEPLATCFTVEACLHAMAVDLYVAPYKEHVQEILDPSRPLHQRKPEFVIVLLSPDAVVPGLIREPWGDTASRAEQLQERLAEYIELLSSLRKHSRATIIAANFVLFEPSPLGVLDWQERLGLARVVHELNRGLADWAHMQERVYVFDLAGLAAAFGQERAFDSRMRLLADQPLSTAFVPRLAAELVRYLPATAGPSRKCLVLDLDNTLWGGILGEDGPSRLRLGGDPVGEAYRRFQQAILGLHRRGILLALCSRNDEDEAMAVLRDHPGMVLRPEHFASFRINWNDKVANLQSLATEIGIGVDSLVFVDDDPFERQSVRERLPEVLVVDLPSDPALYRETLLGLNVFDTLNVTAEDRERGRMYQERRERERLRSSASSLEEYLLGLKMEVLIVPPAGPNRTRLFQLVHKTNQFNLTTRRYTESEFDALTGAPDCRVFGIRVRDRLGDNGIVGLMVLRFTSDACDIETFLLSCRVLGRSIESGILAHAAEVAGAAGATRMVGRYVSTAKNGIVRDLYVKHGFASAGRDRETELWEADLARVPLVAPPWVHVQAQDGREV